jgi:hypothetical protein
MIRTREEYRAGLRDGCEIWIEGVRLHDVTTQTTRSATITSPLRLPMIARSTEPPVTAAC